ncbi:MAG: DNA-3-methyladenine glycosylase [Thermoanaerobaculum sp.]|nr:DNA-3-methyladenine glycosylase [Thermoanaerobaculum sp.]MDW7966511.1 DNA-3-methyladenine glycosylase [Thermoanaerobaculum sp.]
MAYPLEVWQRAVLPREFYQRDTVAVARELLGKVLVRRTPEGVVALRLMEVEAYLGVDDPAAHTAGGRRTPRNEVMWGEAGHLYVYFTYGMHFCANVVTRAPGQPEAVLLRGGVVLWGDELVQRRRRGRGDVNGPAKLCQALALTRRENGTDLTEAGEVFLAEDGFCVPPERVLAVPRVGVEYAGAAALWPLRFVVRGFPAVGLRSDDGAEGLPSRRGAPKPR